MAATSESRGAREQAVQLGFQVESPGAHLDDFSGSGNKEGLRSRIGAQNPGGSGLAFGAAGDRIGIRRSVAGLGPEGNPGAGHGLSVLVQDPYHDGFSQGGTAEGPLSFSRKGLDRCDPGSSSLLLAGSRRHGGTVLAACKQQQRGIGQQDLEEELPAILAFAGHFELCNRSRQFRCGHR